MAGCSRRYFPFVSMEEVRVSDVEVCNLAYRGQLEELRSALQRDKSLASITDQVRGGGASCILMLEHCLTSTPLQTSATLGWAAAGALQVSACPVPRGSP